MNDPIIAGVIDRISGSGNAMLRAGNNEYNLGPLPHRIVGNPAIAIPRSDPWAVCITPYIKRDQYLSDFTSVTGMNRRKMECLIENAIPSISDNFDTNLPSQPSEGLVTGTSIEVQIVASGPKASYVLFDNGSAVEIEVPFLPSKHKTTIEFIDTNSHIQSATLDESVLKGAPEPGAKLTIEILGTDGSTAYALYESVPVVLPNCPVSKGDYMHAEVISKNANGVKATVAAFPENERLNVGDSFELDLNVSPGEADITLVHDRDPIRIPAPKIPIKGKAPLTVTAVESNTVTAEVDFSSWNGTKFEIGQVLSCSDLERRRDWLVGRYDDMPLALSITNEPPVVPNNLDVVITDSSPHEISVSIKNHPRLESLQEKDIITIPITNKKDDYLIGEHRGFPVWISCDVDILPPELTVEVSHLTDYGIFASVATLPENAIPKNQIVPAKIEEVYTSEMTILLKITNDSYLYVVPVLLPLKLDIQGKVGIEIVDKSNSYLIGILRTINVGKEVESVSVYLLESQRALMALRRQSPAEAVSAWESAAEETNSELREVDAKRSAMYGNAEEALKNRDGGKAESLLKDFQDYLDRVEISSQYRSYIDNELYIYNKLIIASMEEPGSLTGLQQIAYSISNKVSPRSRVEQAAAKIQIPSKKLDGDWKPVFPHPFVVDRIRQLSEQFDSIPDTAKDILSNFPRLEETQWSVAPAPSDEPKPTETVDVKPVFPDASSVNNGKNRAVKGSKISGEGPPTNTSETQNAQEDTASTVNNSQIVDNISSVEKAITSRSRTTDNDPLDIEDSKSGEEPSSPPSGQSDRHNESNKLVVNKETPTISQTSTTLRKLRQKAEKAASETPVRDTSQTGGGSRYQRAKPIKDFVKARANGVCEACGEPAPFRDNSDEPYLEAHHVEELGKGGEDHPAKVVAICPTCHKRVHHGQRGEQLNEALREKLQNGLARVGLD
jgi:predicted HNH restriction endonuclease